MNHDDPRLTDEATGLPPLEDLQHEYTIVALAWTASVGVAMSPLDPEPVAVRYLHLRGLVSGEGGPPDNPVWGQVFVAVPVDAALEVAAALAKGTTEQLDET